MIRFFHTYRKSFIGLLFVCVIAFMMSGFGLDALRKSQSRDDKAIIVDDVHVSRQEFLSERRNIQRQYQRMLGKNYGQFAEQLDKRLNQDLIDRTIADVLLQRQAENWDFTVGQGQLEDVLRKDLIQAGGNPDVSRAYLRELGMSAVEYENKLRHDLLRAQFAALLNDSSRASIKEAKVLMAREKTSYTVSYLEVDPKNFEKNVSEPSAADLSAYYQDRAANFEIPASVSYEYVVFDPEKMLNEVQASNDEAELYYAENSEKFMKPEAVNVRHIQINFTAGTDPEKINERKQLADTVHEKVVAGESFDSLALQYSDDVATKALGGTLGWIEKGRMDPAFDRAAFALKEGGIADVVSTDYGFHVVKVESYRAQEPRPFSEVKEEIELFIKKELAPSLIADKAALKFDEWTKKKGQSLADFAKEQKLVAASSNGQLTLDKDPEEGLAGLTKSILQGPAEPAQTVELGNKTILVSVLKLEEARIPAASELETDKALKEKVLAAYRASKSVELARTKADEIVDLFKKGTLTDLSAAAKANDLKVSELKDVTTQTATGILTNSEVQNSVFQSAQVNQKPSRAFVVAGKYYVVQVTNISQPELKETEAELAAYRDRQSREMGQLALVSYVNKLKAKAVIDVDSSLMAIE